MTNLPGPNGSIVDVTFITSQLEWSSWAEIGAISFLCHKDAATGIFCLPTCLYNRLFPTRASYRFSNQSTASRVISTNESSPPCSQSQCIGPSPLKMFISLQCQMAEMDSAWPRLDWESSGFCFLFNGFITVFLESVFLGLLPQIYW